MDPEHRARLAALDALARRADLSAAYVLKGGLALHLAYGSPRRSDDLDLTAVRPFGAEVSAETDRVLVDFGHAYNEALAEAAPRYGFARLAVQRRRLSDLLPCVLAEIGFSEAPTDAAPLPGVVEMQVTLSEVVCATARAEHGGIALHVPALEDILAEKLKALLQQPLLGTHRPTDVYDVWYFTAQAPRRTVARHVAAYLRQKVEPWPELHDLRRSRFHDPAVAGHARTGYDALAGRLGGAPLPPFDEAMAHVLRFTDSLDLPA